MTRIEMTLVFSGLISAVGGIAFSMIALRFARRDDETKGTAAMNLAHHLLLAAMLCLAIQYAVHQWSGRL